jgi:glycosyltransferase involved in cell wall biosynthesis
MSLFPRRGLGSQLPEYDPKLEDFESLGIRGLQLGTGRWTFDCGYPVWAVDRVEDALPECLESFQPQVVWCNCFPSLPLLLKARDCGLGALWYVHDCRPEAEDLRRASEAGIALLAVSEFISQRIRRFTGGPCEVVYPLIRESDYITSRDSPEYITLINPRPVKGYQTFLAVAAKLPEKQFLVVEAWPLGEGRPAVERELAELGNVKFVRQLADTRAIYRQTRLLLVPSVVEEGGPRVIREAQLNGIPVVGSNRGGVPEMIGDGGVVISEYENPSAWAEAILEVLGDAERYARWSEASRRNAGREELQSATIVRQFFQACCRAAQARTPRERL